MQLNILSLSVLEGDISPLWNFFKSIILPRALSPSVASSM
jgi:hypothetical protein